MRQQDYLLYKHIKKTFNKPPVKAFKKIYKKIFNRGCLKIFKKLSLVLGMENKFLMI